jgi:SPP1 family predicted phage head-tail adaptor
MAIRKLHINGGTYRDRITVERAMVITGEYNEPSETWAVCVNLWARKTDISAGEKRAASEVGAELSARFLVRYSPESKAITPKDRIVFENNTYNITGVREVTLSDPHTNIEIDTVIRADK